MPLLWFRNSPVELAAPVLDATQEGYIDATHLEFTVEEGQPFTFFPQFDQFIEVLEFQGGADDEFFLPIGGPGFTWAPDFFPDFGSPSDDGGNNTYILNFKAVGADGALSSTIIVTVTVTEAPISVGAATASLLPASDLETLVVSPTATNATSFEYQIEGAGAWFPLDPSFVISGVATGYKIRGVSGGFTGAATALLPVTLLSTPTFYSANAINIDGTAYFTSGITGASDSTKFTAVVTCLPTTEGTTRRLITATGTNPAIRFQADGTIQVHLDDTSSATAVELVTTNSFPANAGFYQILLSVDTTTSTALLYVNGQRVTSFSSQTVVADAVLDLTRTTWAIAATPTGTVPLIGSLSDTGFIIGTAIDFTNLVNLRRFRWHNGLVRDPGSNGSNWFGAAATVLLSGATATFGTNDGTAGGFNTTGTPTQASVGPNGSLVVGELTTALKSDAAIEMQCVQANPDRGWERYTNTGWHALANAANIRYVRGQRWHTVGPLAHARALFDTYGIRVTCSFNAIDENGAFQLGATDNILAGLRDDLGLECLYRLEGANEYPISELWASCCTVTSIADNQITLLPLGSRSRNVSAPEAQSATPAWLVNGQKVQLSIQRFNTIKSSYGGTMPTGIVRDQVYIIRNRATVGDAYRFTLETEAGAAVNIDSTGTIPTNYHLVVSPFAPRFRDYTAYLRTKVNDTTQPPAGVGDLSWAEWHAAGGVVSSGSVWGRVVIDLQAIGDVSAHVDELAEHLYNGARPPHLYNGTTGFDPILESIQLCQIMGPGVPVALTEKAQDAADSWNPSLSSLDPGPAATGHPVGSMTVSTTIQNVQSKYTGREWFEHFILLKEGHLAPKASSSHFAMCKSGQEDEYQEFLEFNESTNVYSPQPHYYTMRNINHHLADATWNSGPKTWTYPTFTPGSLDVVLETPAPSTPDEEIVWFLLQKSTGGARNVAGKYYLVVCNRAASWIRQPKTIVTVADVACTLHITSTTMSTAKVFDPTVLEGEDEDDKRDDFTSLNVTNLRNGTGVTLNVKDQVILVELTPA